MEIVLLLRRSEACFIVRLTAAVDSLDHTPESTALTKTKDAKSTRRKAERRRIPETVHKSRSQTHLFQSYVICGSHMSYSVD